MECANEIFPLVLYTLGSILLILLIILSVKAMKTLKKANETLDQMNEKMSKFDDVFDVAIGTRDLIASLGDKMISTVMNGLIGLFSKKTRKEEDENE